MKRPESYTAAVTEQAPPDRGQGKRARLPLPGRRRPSTQQVERTSMTLELNADLVPLLRQIADALSMSPASVVDRLLFDALHRFVADEIQFDDCLSSSRSPRYLYVVDLDFGDLQPEVSRYLAGISLVESSGHGPEAR